MPHQKTTDNPNDQAIALLQRAAKEAMGPGNDPPYLDPATLLTESDPSDVLRKGERVKRELEDVDTAYHKMIETDHPSPVPPPPAILAFPGVLQAVWIVILDMVLKAAYTAIGLPDAKRPINRTVSTLGDALALANDAYNRTHTAIDGKNPNAPQAVALRAAVFGGRPRPAARDDWKTEFELMKSAILSLNPCPPELSDMMLLLQGALDAVSQAAFGVGGRPRETYLYSRPALAAVLAVDTALDRLLKSAGARADGKLLAKLKSIITPRRKADQATPAQDEPPPNEPPPAPEPAPTPDPPPTQEKAARPTQADKPESKSAPESHAPTHSAPAQPQDSPPPKPQAKAAKSLPPAHPPVTTRNARGSAQAKKSTRRR